MMSNAADQMGETETVQLKASANGHSESEVVAQFPGIYLVRGTDERRGPGLLSMTSIAVRWTDAETKDDPPEWEITFADVNMHAIGSGEVGSESTEGSYLLVLAGETSDEVRLGCAEHDVVWALYERFCEGVAASGGGEDDEGSDDEYSALFTGGLGAGGEHAEAVLGRLDEMLEVEDGADGRFDDAEDEIAEEAGSHGNNGAQASSADMHEADVPDAQANDEFTNVTNPSAADGTAAQDTQATDASARPGTQSPSQR